MELVDEASRAKVQELEFDRAREQRGLLVIMELERSLMAIKQTTHPENQRLSSTLAGFWLERL